MRIPDMVAAHWVTWSIAAAATAAVILRPLRIPEAVWASAGAFVLVAFGLLPSAAAVDGIEKGTDVYLFLVGMMILAELARQEGLFDWLAARAAAAAQGSATRLFDLVYIVGIAVTVFLSNDATAVVLTPAVSAVTRAAAVERPLPYLLICAFVANAASFVLPISNPANLVVYGKHMPTLLEWLPRYALPSLAAIGVTFVVLRLTQREALQQRITTQIIVPALSATGRLAAVGIAATAGVLMAASAFGMPLGLPTCVAGLIALVVVTVTTRSSPWRFVREISWGIIPLVAGMFVLVEALDRSGAIRWMSDTLRATAQRSGPLAAAGSGVVVGVAANLVNNLPAGVVAGTALQSAKVASIVTSAVLVGVDLGPNLSATGSLATLLWLAALRRDGVHVRSWDFLKLGLLIMPPALFAALGALLLTT